MSNIILALMQNDSPDKFAEDVANAYFANPDHVRRLLNADCIEECVNYVIDNQRVEFDLSDLDLFNESEPLFSKPSRQKGYRKHNKKEVRRKGSAKRFRDRSRKCAAEGHMYHVYHRGLVGDYGVRGRRLAETGEITTKRFHHKDFSGEIEKIIEPNMCVSNIYYPDGSRISVEMNSNNWYEYNEELATLREQVESGYDDIEDYDDYCDLTNGRNWSGHWYDHEWEIEDEYDFDDEDDEIIDDDETLEEPESPAPYQNWVFDTQELADFMQKLANATPKQRALVRQFFAENL